MNTGVRLDKQYIEDEVVKILTDMTRDFDVQYSGNIASETWLMSELGCESIDIVMLIVAIEEKFQRKALPFDELFMREGEYVTDLSVGQLRDFLAHVLT